MNLFDLQAAISLDSSGYESKLNDAARATESFGSRIRSGLGTAAKVGAAALAAASVGIGKLLQASIDSYAQYEQLIGGVETIFGAGGKSIEEYAESVGKSVEDVQEEYNKLELAQSTVLSNAERAFRSAGMSQNEYMETVTGFSSSLIQSLKGDTVEASNLADVAIQDMADNANKMGTAMESIQNAYQGFAKQNYTINYLSAA